MFIIIKSIKDIYVTKVQNIYISNESYSFKLAIH